MFTRVLLLLLLSLPSWLVAQRAPTPNAEFTQKNNAFVFGVHLHTYGAGGDLQYRRRLNDRVDLLFSYNIASYKNPSEGRTPSLYAAFGGRDYIFDKINYCYINGFTVGAQYSLVKRSEFNRVQITAGGGIGPALAILKPYLLDVDDGNNFLVSEQYRGPVEHPREEIFGQADFISGFGNIQTQLGLKVRGDLTIDLSGNSYFVKGIHLGVQADLFSKELPLLYEGKNRKAYVGAFIGFVVGNAWE